MQVQMSKRYSTVFMLALVLACAPLSPAYADWGAGETTLLAEIENAVYVVIPGRMDLIRGEVVSILELLSGADGMKAQIDTIRDVLVDAYSTSNDTSFSNTIGKTTDAAINPEQSGSISGRVRGLQYTVKGVYDKLTTINTQTEASEFIALQIRDILKSWTGTGDLDSVPAIFSNFNTYLNNLSSTVPSALNAVDSKLQSISDDLDTLVGSSGVGGVITALNEVSSRIYSGNQQLVSLNQVLGNRSDAAIGYEGTGSINARLRWIEEHLPVGGSNADLSGVTSAINSLSGEVNYIRSSVDSIYTAVGDFTEWMETLQNTLLTALGTDNEDYMQIDQNNVNGRLGWMQHFMDSNLGRLDNMLQYIIQILESGVTVNGSNVDELLEWLQGVYDHSGSEYWSVNDVLGNQYLSSILGVLEAVDSCLDGISHLLGQWFVMDTADDVIGEVDWSALGQKGVTLGESVSALAPFAGALVLSECFSILANVGKVQQPSFDMPFDFGGFGGNHVVIDLGFMADAKPLFNFICLMLLFICLANVSLRVMTMEAAS